MVSPVVITVGIQGPPGPQGPSGAVGPVFGGTLSHSILAGLDYASAGHTGFESAANAQFVSGNLESHINHVDADLQFVSGNLVTRIINSTGSLTQDHAGLTNLAYASSAHTDFAGTGVTNVFSHGQQFAAGLQATGSLLVNGDTTTTRFQMTSGSHSGYVLTSDAVGNARWTASGSGGGSSVIVDHSALDNLTYAASGHTGFAGTAVTNDFTSGQHIEGDLQVTGSVRVNSSTDSTFLGTGRVGVGVLVPAQKLEVVGDIKASTSSDTLGGGGIYLGQAGLLKWNFRDTATGDNLALDYFEVGTGWFNAMTVLGANSIGDSGNVGIGIAAPIEKLHVVGATILQGNTQITGSLRVSGGLVGDGSLLTNVTGSLTKNHAALTNLAYAASGHTGFESQANAQFVSGNLVTRIINSTGSLTQDHAGLTNLGYTASGHTGFESQANAQFVSGNLVTRITNSTGSLTQDHAGLTNLAYTASGHTGFESQANAQFVSGNLVTRIINSTGSLTQDHAGLTNLAYTTSNHTGFAGTGVSNTFSAGQRITGDLQVTGSLRSDNLNIGDSTVSRNSVIYTRNGTFTIAGDVTQTTEFVHDVTDNSILSTTADKGLRFGTADFAPLKFVTGNTVRATISDDGVFDLGPATTTSLGVSGSTVITGSLAVVGTALVTGDLTTSNKITTVKFQMSSGSSAGYVLTSDAAGNARWTASGSGGGTGGTMDHAGLNNLGYAESSHTGFESQANAQFVSGNFVTSIINSTGSLTRDHAGLTNLAYTASGHTGFESQANAQFVSGNLVTRIINSTGSLTQDHAGLTNLSYASSSHTGFAGTAVSNAFSAGQRITAGGAQITGSLLMLGDTHITGSVYADMYAMSMTPPGMTHTEGHLYWDSTWKTGALKLEDDVTLQLGQETMAYVYNGTAVPLLNGQAVYVSGSQAGVPLVKLAQADAYETSFVLGVITSTTIGVGAYGYATIRGHINDVDTSGWSVGDSLYLSPTTAGAFTNVQPSGGQYDVRVGRVMISDVGAGRIFVNIRTAMRLQDLADVTTTSPVLDEVLRYNGVEWVNGAPAVSSASPGLVFYNSTPTILTGSTQNPNVVNTLSKTPVTTTQQIASITCSVGGTVYQGAAWLYPTAIGRTTIDAGVWTFSTYAAVSSILSGRVTTLTRQIYQVVSASVVVSAAGTGTTRTVTASVGSPFPTSCVVPSATNTVASFLQTPKGLYQISARASNTSITIDTPTGYTNESNVPVWVWYKLFANVSPAIITTGTTYGLYTHESTQPTIPMATSDRLGGIMFGQSTAATNIAVVYNGTDYNTRLSTPLITLHNDLAGLQGGTSNEDYHLTAAEYTGSGTGVFVRQTGPTIANPFVTGVLQVTGSVQATTGLRVGPGSDASATLYVSGSSSTNLVEVDDWRGQEVLEVHADGSSVFRADMQITGSLYVSGTLYGGGAVQSSLTTGVGPSGTLVNLAHAYASTADYEGAVILARSGSVDVGGWLDKTSASSITVYANVASSSVFWIVARKTQ